MDSLYFESKKPQLGKVRKEQLDEFMRDKQRQTQHNIANTLFQLGSF